MVITKYEPACIKVQSGEMVFVFDPPSRESRFKTPRFQADVVCISEQHPDRNGAGEIQGKGERLPVVLSGPGEYEVAGVRIWGVPVGEARTAYVVVLEGVRLTYLAEMNGEITPFLRSALGEVDILFLPITEPKRAASQSAHVRARVVIPLVLAPETLSVFLSQLGTSPRPAPVDRLTIKAKDLTGMSGGVIILA